MLTELVIHDNPLTNQCSHMPQMLQMLLADQLGIHVQRKKDRPIPKPVIDIPQKPGRRVSTAVERVPKCSIDEILALESGQSLFERDKPHDDRRRHSLEEPLQQPTQGARPRHSTKDRLPPIRQSHHMTGGEDIEEPPPGGMEEETAGDAFFMTQFLMDEPEGKTTSKDEVVTERSTGEDGKGMKKKKRKIPEEVKDVDDRYKGYELLLDIDESALDPDIPIPKDLHGNVRALRYMLEHPLVYRENTIHLERRQKPFEPYRRRGQMLGPKRKMRPEQIEDVLSTLRNRTCVIEAPLKDVLTHPKKYRKDFGNANQLLSEVRTQYIYLFRPFHINDVYYIITEIKNYQINKN
ncbi:hypothetical protein NP493_5778g00000 [Ridgeia piscesae]|uniref:Uncharacterized protein n=1 Tax=Ridgeia piscesae TaxID=27915 RepID=A0AAD9MQW5_RIDPI|nr:hypothetical protein NP493_5778g00000 [Ridgeia piscesae]